MDARYVFHVRLRLESNRSDVVLDPQTVETRCALDAPEPGTEGWRFFRETLWRGSVSDHEYACRLVDDWLEPPVEDVSFRALHTDSEYLAALKNAIADDLEAFKADDVTEVISKYFGSSLMVTDDGDDHQ